MTSNSKPAKLTGLVAAILNERELVINIGSEEGIEQGMKFKVLDEPFEVRDPETDELLDTISQQKIRVKVVEVRRLVAIARTYETYKLTTGGYRYPTTAMLDIFGPPRTETRVRTLRYDDSEAPKPIDPAKCIVKIGDKVELILDDE